MATLREQLLNDEVRPKLVDDCIDLLDREVASKKGFKGAAIKAAYKTVKAIRPGFVRGVLNYLLDGWVDKLEPYYEEHLASGGSGSFGQSLGRQPAAVAESLLEVTDERARVTEHKTAKKLYDKLRPSAKDHVSQAVPGLGRVADRYLD